MTLALPLLDKDSLDLTRVGDDLVVTVAGPTARARAAECACDAARCVVRTLRVTAGDQVPAGPRAVPACDGGTPVSGARSPWAVRPTRRAG